MSTVTLNTLRPTLIQAPRFGKPSVSPTPANLPDLQADARFQTSLLSVTLSLALACVPFAALGWMFLAR